MKSLTFLLFLSIFGNFTSEKEIAYRQLTWADFRGPIAKNEPWVQARSTCQIEMSNEYSGDVHHFTVVTYFLADSSFVRIKSDHALLHEQTHFRIACIEATRLRLALGPLQGGDSIAYAKALDLYSQYFNAMVALNHQFDSAADHGRNPVAEKEWEDKISLEFTKLGAH